MKYFIAELLDDFFWTKKKIREMQYGEYHYWREQWEYYCAERQWNRNALHPFGVLVHAGCVRHD